MNKIFNTICCSFIFAGCGSEMSSAKKDTVTYTQENGEKTTDLSKVEGKAKFKIIGPGTISNEAIEFHNKAKTKGQKGEYAEALILLNKAINVEPSWSYPHYDMAFTYLLMAKPKEALKKYKEVDKLEPKGFFTTKTAIWCLEAENKGQFKGGTYLMYLSLEWLDQDKKSEYVNQIYDAIPNFPPIIKEKALLTEDPVVQLELINKAINLKPDLETYGILLLNKASLLFNQGKKVESKKILDDLINNIASTQSTKVLANQVIKFQNNKK